MRGAKPMNDSCQQLDDFLDGELKADRRNAFQAHLTECPTCRSQVELFVHLNNEFATAWKNVSAPDALVQRIAAEWDQVDLEHEDDACEPSDLNELPIACSQSNPPRWRVALGWMVVAASLALLIYGAAFWNTAQQPINAQRSAHDSASDSADAPQKATVEFSTEGVGQNTLLVRSPRSNKRFTIVKAYPVFASSAANPTMKGSNHDQSN